MLDPVYGCKDPGNQDGPHQEKTYTLLLAQEAAGQVRGPGSRLVDAHHGHADKPAGAA